MVANCSVTVVKSYTEQQFSKTLDQAYVLQQIALRDIYLC